MNTRRDILFLFLIVIGSVYIGLCLVSGNPAVELFSDVGYWTISLSFALFVLFLFRSYASCLLGVLGRVPLMDWVIGVAVVLFAVLFVTREEPAGFKTIMDDHVIAATSFQMHRERVVEVPTRAHHIGGVQMVLRSYVDKRPIFFPYLGSLVSDFTGYRILNTVYLNRALCPVFFVLLFIIAYRLSGRWGGAVAVLLMASIPLLSQTCSGGGLELLSMVMILLALLLGALFLNKPSEDRLAAFVFAAVLLAQSRYESVIFLLPVALLVLYWWIRERQIKVLWPLYLCPVLLIPYLWQHQVFYAHSYMWQMEDVKRGTEPFGLSYVADNLGRSLNWFFSVSEIMGNSVLLSVLGIISIVFLIVMGLSRARNFPEISNTLRAFIFFGLGFALLYLLLLCYSWPFDNILIRRLSLPLYIPLALAAALLVYRVVTAVWVQWTVFALTLLFYFAYALPISAKRIYTLEYMPGHEFQWAQHFMDNNKDERMLVIADDSAFFILQGKDGLSTVLANKRKGAIKYYIDQVNAPPVYYFQRMVWDPAKQQFVNSAKMNLDDDFVLETTWEKSISEVRRVQFSRIVDVKGVELEEQTHEDPMSYLRAWANNLP